jgi:ADP-ribose pyrophosphatase YjhB (NUDIX family)
VGVLAGWRFCPRCASELNHLGGSVECPSCGLVHYANSAPAVSAFVTDREGRVLLARRAADPDAGLWDAPGGFLDEGELPEDGLRREFLEETGLDIEIGTFVGTFVDRYGDAPDAASVLNLVWEATFGAGEPVPADDVSELRWFALDALPDDSELAFTWLARCLRSWAAAVADTDS